MELFFLASTLLLGSKSLLAGITPTKNNCPSVWQYFDFRQAKVKLNLGERRKILESDALDADMYGCSPYYDVPVMQDRNFRDTIELVKGDVFEPELRSAHTNPKRTVGYDYLMVLKV